MLITAVFGPVDYTAAASEVTKWVKTDISSIQSGDEVMITMSKEGTTWALPNTATGSKKQPLVVEVDTTDMTSVSGCSWTIEKVEGGFYIKNGSDYLYMVSNDNNGVRIGTTQAVWSVDSASGYLTAMDMGGSQRWMGVYNKTDWRAYTSVHDNIAGATLAFYKNQTPSTPANPTVCAPVTASPAQGPVVSGASITLSCATSGATIRVDLSGNGNYSEYTGPITVNFGEGESFAFRAYSECEGLTDSAPVTFNYTKAQCAPVMASPNGGAVDAGTKVNLSCTTSGAAIYYSTDANADVDSYTLYTNGIVINEATTIKAYAKADGYKNSEVATISYTIASATTPEDSNVATLTNTLKDGNVVLMYYQDTASGKVLSATANGKKLAGVDATPENGKITIPEGAVQLTVSIDDNGYYTFISQDGKYLTSGETGSSLTFAATESDYSLWTLEPCSNGNGFHIASVNAKYNATVQYIEYYNGFTTYSYKSGSDTVYDLTFYKIKEGTPTFKVDSSFVGTVAQWAGGLNNTVGVYDTATFVYADRFTTNDELDRDSKFTVVLDELETFVYTDPSTHGTEEKPHNHYMGSAGFGTNDYFQLETSSYGFANMDLSFRMRVTKAAPAEYTVQYSTDGQKFVNFLTGSYEAKYTKYVNQEPTDKEYSGTITNGIAKFNYDVANAGAYVTFKFDVPAEASNAQKLYIRIVGGATKANEATGEPSGTVRIDTVKITGNPVISSDVTGYVTANPESGNALLGQELTLTSETAGAAIYYSFDGNTYHKYNAESKPVLSTFPVNVAAYAEKDGKKSIVTTYSYEQAKCEMIKATPNGGAVVVGTKVTLRCNTEGAAIKYAFVTENSDNLTWLDYTEPFVLEKLPAEIKVKAVKEGYLDSEVATLTFAERENDKYNIYFGQLHSHTNYSDGAGSVEEAYQYAKTVENLDFLAVTDHSNSFDEADNSVISENKDTAATNEWTKGHELAKQYSSEDFTCLFGYEMTWSNGLGHMNTFNTPGYQSRTQTAYKTYSTALQNYYAALNTVPDSISMFNHPGTTFGDFSDFSYWSEANDSLINLIEVGNGEGAIGSSGYFPSYEYYTRALDKGWHVSPTNNQDNHKGFWGNANTGRSVVLADKNTEELIYDAMRNHRMYATEDNNLNIYYTLDGYIMGTVLEKDQVADTVEIKVELSDADATDKIGKVEVIVNGGLTIASKDVATNAETVTFNVPTNYSYYYIKVTQGDRDIAVTSPVWVGNVEACGINKTYTNSVLAVQGESVDINVDFYNNESVELVIDSIEVKVEDKVIHSSTKETLESAGVSSIASKGGTGTYSFEYAHNGVGSVTYELSVKATLNGVEKIYSDKLELSYTVPSLVTKVIIDGSHYNDYVTGYYGGRMGEFTKVCADKNIQVVIDTDGITAQELEDCALLLISAPAKKSGTDNAGDYVVSHFEDEFMALVKDYVANGGSVIVCGLADYQDSTNGQTATEQNKLLAAIGSTIRVNSDEAYDEVNNGGQAYRLYPEVYNKDSKWLAGVVEGQKYSQYSGCTVDITNAVENDVVYAAEALVKGFDTTYSIDCKDASGNKVEGQPPYIEKGTAVFMAAQETKAGGNIFVTGAVFASDFEVAAEMDNNDSLPYINYTIVKNILTDIEKELELSTIAEARKGNLKDLFAVEGYVTAGTANEYTKFFDSIYIQDETGGICIFPFADTGLEIGTKMRITGYLDEYQGEKELQIMKYKILDAEKKVYEPKEITTKQANDYDTFGGQLVKVTGTVTRVELTTDGKGIAEYWVKDASGVEAAVFIDGYILSGTKGNNTLASIVKVGEKVSGCGVLYKHPEGASDVSVPVLRVRDCDEIVKASSGTPDIVVPETPVPGIPDIVVPGTGSSGNTDTQKPETEKPENTDTQKPEDEGSKKKDKKKLEITGVSASGETDAIVVSAEANVKGLSFLEKGASDTYKKVYKKPVTLQIEKQEECTYYYKVVVKGKAGNKVKWKKLKGDTITVKKAKNGKRIYLKCVMPDKTSLVTKTNGFKIKK